MTDSLSRRALLATAGVSAAAAGGWFAWRRATGPSSASSSASSSAPSPASSPLRSASTAQAGAAAGADGNAPLAAEASLIQGDQLTRAFWEQTFDRPDGSQLALVSRRGQPLLINFWATWCPPCVKEMPELDEFRRAFSPKGWHVLGLAIDGPTPVREFLAKVRVGFEIGLAGFGGTELAQALGNQSGGLPFTVLIDSQGKVRRRKMGATHVQELAAWATEIQTG